MAVRKRPIRKPPPPKKCGPCDGTGEVTRSVRVGRKQRVVGQQTGICLACFGSGKATD
ncbi:hypothetical protein ACFPH6_30770 [Streptomyces xiangluensis]|uniref:Molecular chaperone DnaJ n=1 Tax=Streptomyces xiangluensis TaxID=2665720 RepID=A0ABV8YX59_9ACTN